MSTKKKSRKRKITLLVLLALAGVAAYIGWDRFFREHPQPDWVTSTEELRFKYGSIGAEHDAGIPYWIFYVLPRLFPDKFPGPGGYDSLGVVWEEGMELPVGFSKKTIGFPRMANNCAACHATTWRSKHDEMPTVVATGPNHTLDLEAFFRLLVDIAKDPRFNADNLMREINQVTELDWLDRLSYRFLIIPITKKRLLEREQQFAWIYREDFPEWGRGRDDAMNLTKYFMIGEDMDDTIGPTDMPSVWNLKKYRHDQGHRMNWAGDSHNARSVIMDSALGLLGAEPHDQDDFLAQIDWLQHYLENYPPPKYPFPIDAALEQQGAAVFDAECARCHASDKTGVPMPVDDEVRTDKERIATWGKDYAIKANQVASDMGLERMGLVEEPLIGYVVPFLDGIWLRAPYLHNGSVPTLRDLLNPAAQRPQLFWRGYDVYDQDNVGFISQGGEAERVGTPYDTTLRSNGNNGHEFGTALAEEQKQALLEYLKGL